MADLYEGLEFPPSQFELTADMVAAYIEAVDEPGEMYRGTGLVPPTAVAAFAMTELSRSLTIPPGSVHVAQELSFLGTVTTGETVTCTSRVSRKVDRGQMHLVSIDIRVHNREQKPVLTGRLTFMLPPTAPDGGART